MKFCTVKPSVMMYKTSNLCGEVSDELLFGTTLELISEDDTTAFCRTHYGYCGYINRWEICECEAEDCDDGEKVFVCSRCDVLAQDKYGLAPVLSLPKGSRIKIFKRQTGRFSQCVIGNKILYIPNFALCQKSYDTFGSAVANTALEYLGAPYRWGGKSDTGIDCSGLAFMAFALSGARLWRDAVFDEKYVYKIEEREVSEGDLAYFNGHVAIMTGRESFVHASASAGRVVVGDFSDRQLSKENVLCFARARENKNVRHFCRTD